MEDDKIKDLFTHFSPGLSSDEDFLTNLQRNLNCVESIRHQNDVTRRRNRIAMVVSACCGFAVGVLFSIFFPLLVDMIPEVEIRVPYLILRPMVIDCHLIIWIVAAVVSSLTAYNVYEIILSRSSGK